MFTISDRSEADSTVYSDAGCSFHGSVQRGGVSPGLIYQLSCIIIADDIALFTICQLGMAHLYRASSLPTQPT